MEQQQPITYFLKATVQPCNGRGKPIEIEEFMCRLETPIHFVNPTNDQLNGIVNATAEKSDKYVITIPKGKSFVFGKSGNKMTQDTKFYLFDGTFSLDGQHVLYENFESEVVCHNIYRGDNIVDVVPKVKADSYVKKEIDPEQERIKGILNDFNEMTKTLDDDVANLQHFESLLTKVLNTKEYVFKFDHRGRLRGTVKVGTDYIAVDDVKKMLELVRKRLNSY